ncbi:hypothetical protein H4582DRAFT_1587935 [Lactarius indigo]|nr:hypothetical protein H4582DRAFT_1587935 [Lactarius indigo]
MYIIMNLGTSPNFAHGADFMTLQYLATTLVDYICVYQLHDAHNIGCDLVDRPTVTNDISASIPRRTRIPTLRHGIHRSITRRSPRIGSTMAVFVNRMSLSSSSEQLALSLC